MERLLRAWMGWIAACWGLATASLGAGEWPQFRGPLGNGHASARNLPLSWNEATHVVWKTAIPGKGWSSPVLSAGRVYVTTAVPQGEDETGPWSLRALCVDAATGQVLWDEEVFAQPAGAPKIHSKNSHASPTPLVHGDRLFVHFGHQGTACLDLSGRVRWRATAHRYEPVHGNGGSPVLVDGLLIFNCDGAEDPFVIALDAATGQERWRFYRTSEADNKFSFSTPAVIEVGGRQQLITPGSGVVNALDPVTGREIWRVPYGQGYSVIPKPLYAHGMVYVATGYNTPMVMAIRPENEGGATEAQVVWTYRKAAPHTPSLLIVDDLLYMVSDKGIATCLDARTGREIWQERLGGNYSASPLFADGKIFLQSEEGPAVILRPGPRFDRLAQTGFAERTLASYAVDDEALVIRTQHHLYRVAVAAGR
jgi:outer membrane protein assembly factor BamB